MTDALAETHARLIHALESMKATIGVVGLGYVGLPLSLAFVDAGYRVVGFDIDEWKVAKLNHGESYIGHIHNDRIRQAAERGFEATTDYARASEADALILCVPTPLDGHREPDMSFIVGTMDSLKSFLRPGQILSLESTTYPGTSEEVLLPRMEEGGLTVGEDVFLVYSPEREDPGNEAFTTRSIPKIVGGHTSRCLEVGLALYGQAIDTLVPVSGTRVAELTKLLENIQRAVNIGLVNELKLVADRMGIDIFEVVRAAATKPFGFTPYFPGPGLGGHCIPIDPFYLTWKAREYGVHTRFIELAGEINTSMPDFVVGKLQDALNERGKALRGSKVLILGIAYKKNVDDMRESPAVEILELLRRKGAIIAYSDPYVPAFPAMRRHHFDLTSVELSAESIASYDAVVLATDHDAFDYELLNSRAQLLIDTRGRLSSEKGNVVHA